MTEEQLTLDQMQKELREMPSSPQRLRLCQEFVALADREQARAQQISGRYDLAWAYATAGDPAKALPVCAEFLQMQKETPNTSGKPHWEAVLAVNIACLACDLACDLPQIPLEQCDALLMEFRRQVRTHGIGERLWQSYAGKVAAMTGDLPGLADHLSRFQAAPRDDTSDCEVCEAGLTARFKHKVKRLLENPRYTGQNGYPGILDTETFQCVQSRIQEKTAKQTPKAERQILKLADRLHCASCGSTLYRMGGKNHRKDTLYLKCAHCGITITIQDEILLEEVIHQMEEWDRPEQTSYQPSGEVIRLTNAINRGLEHPDDPQEVISLILQGVAARYACCPDTQEHTNRPLDVCWDHIRLAVSHINISEENTVKVTFQQDHRERTEHGTDSTEAGTDHTGNEKC